MHLRDARAGQDRRPRAAPASRSGSSAQTGDADGCHLHFEIWTAPGWYSGGAPIDPLPTLRSWLAARLTPRTLFAVRVLTVVGNRPQFVKAAAVSSRLRAVGDEVLVHTGQHYDDALSRVFFDELALPRPEHRFDLGGGSNTEQTARMLTALAPLLASEAPDVVLVYGDTNSTLAGALAGAQAGVPVAHVEAGMRSYDRRMPEELNRVLTDHASSLLLCSSPARGRDAARRAGRRRGGGGRRRDGRRLRAAGAAGGRSRCWRTSASSAGEYLLATAHRAGNVDDPARLRALVDVLTGDAAAGRAAAAPAHAGAAGGGGSAGRAGRRDRRAAARVPRVRGAAAAARARC